MNRKKRLEKSIESLEKEIELHKEKQAQAMADENSALERYYAVEVSGLNKTKKRKKEILDKL